MVAHVRLGYARTSVDNLVALCLPQIDAHTSVSSPAGSRRRGSRAGPSVPRGA
ncbi:hypothetical protein ACWGII_41285 [Streptomyces sp. NPDC054855]